MSSATGPSAPIPLADKRATIMAVPLAFIPLAAIAVALRLWVRLFVVRSPGMDDLFVSIALVHQVVGQVYICLATSRGGMGRHWSDLTADERSNFLYYYWVANACYVMSTGFIKLSLLSQFLRIYKSGKMRIVCISLAIIIAMWGLAYAVLAWVPCVPIRASWDFNVSGKCFAYGARTMNPMVATYESQCATNMVFDLFVLLCAVPIYLQKDLQKKQYFAIGAILSVGSFVVAVSVWRLGVLVSHKSSWRPYMDFTWWTPYPVELACLEIDIAMLAASMPVFWPVLEAALGTILITREIHVTEHTRCDDTSMEMSSSGARSPGGSETELNQQQDKVDYFEDSFVSKQVDAYKQHYKVDAHATGQDELHPQHGIQSSV